MKGQQTHNGYIQLFVFLLEFFKVSAAENHHTHHGGMAGYGLLDLKSMLSSWVRMAVRMKSVRLEYKPSCTNRSTLPRSNGYHH